MSRMLATRLGVVTTTSLLALGVVTAPAAASPNTFDGSFSTDGRVTTDFGPEGDGAFGIAVQPNKRLVVVGASAPGGNQTAFALARYLTNGAPDTSFGDDGRVETPFLGAARAVALQPDGKIDVVGGYALSLARYLSDGNLDSSFADNGVYTAGGTFQDFSDIALQPDGKILVVGAEQISLGHFRGILARFTTGGQPDPSFGDGGSVSSADDDSWTNLAVRPDGRIVVAGNVIQRFLSDGSPDQSFGAGGKAPNGPAQNVLVVQPDLKLLLVGNDLNGNMLVERRLENGAIDPSFSGDGRMTVDFGGNDVASAATLQNDGKIVMVGATAARPGGPSSFAVARLNPDGTLDSSFGGGGKKTFDMGSSSSASGVTVQSDGHIAIAGTTRRSDGDTDFAVARLVGNAVPACNGRTTTIAGGEALVLGSTGPDVITGTPYGDGIFANDGADLVCGRGGDDVIDGGAGNDLLFGNEGNDSLFGGLGNDHLDGGPGTDTADGGPDSDTGTNNESQTSIP